MNLNGFIDNSDGNFECYYKIYSTFTLSFIRHRRNDEKDKYKVVCIDNEDSDLEVTISENKNIEWIKNFIKLLE